MKESRGLNSPNIPEILYKRPDHLVIIFIQFLQFTHASDDGLLFIDS